MKRPPRRPLDRALKTAREILAKTVCECGCVVADHATSLSGKPCGTCECDRFRPVRFRVAR